MQPDDGHFETYGDPDAWTQPLHVGAADPTLPTATATATTIGPATANTTTVPRWDGPYVAEPTRRYPTAEPDHPGMEERAFARIAGRPRPAELPGRWNAGRLLRRCAGADESLLAWVPQERPRYTGMGGAVLLTALMAVVSSTAALSIAFHVRSPFVPILVPLGLLWGALIFNLDRWIVASPMPKQAWQRIPTALVRLLMAFAFGVVIAEPLALTVFSSAITDAAQKQSATDVTAYRGLLEACNPAPAALSSGAGAGGTGAPAAVDCTKNRLGVADNVTAAAQKLQGAQAQLAVAQANFSAVSSQYAKMQDTAAADCTGANGHYGDGPVCESLKQAAAAFWTANNGDQLQRLAKDAQQQVDGDAAGLKTAQDAYTRARTSAIDAQVATWRSQHGDPGLLERIKTLQALAASTGVLAVAIWFVRGLFILVDLAPALTKFSSGTTSYDRLVAENLRLGEARNRAERARQEEESEDWVDEAREENSLARARRRAERDAEIDSLLDSMADRHTRAAPARSGTGRERPFGGSTYNLVPQVKPLEVAPARPPSLALTAGHSTGLVRPRKPDQRATEPRVPDRRGRDRPTHRVGDEVESEIRAEPPLNVVTLGGPGVGKTNLMAAMYSRLEAGDPRRGYRLRCPEPEQRNELVRLHDALRSPGSDWPPTNEGPQLKLYEFDCEVPVGGHDYPVLRICYWDYSGEALTTRDDDLGPLRRQLAERIADAHAVMIAVDGVELRESEFDHGDRRRAFEDILVECVRWAERSRCPVQVIVTKWDLVGMQRDAGGVLWDRQRAVEALAGYECMATLFRTRRHRAYANYQEPGPRVIPVSVLGGPGSAVDDGRGVERLKPPEPVNVDVPFAGILPDRLGQLFDGLGTAALERRLSYAKRRTALRVVKTGLFTAGLVLGVLKLVLPVSGLVGVVADRLASLDPASWTGPYVLDKSRQQREDWDLIRNASRLREEAGWSDRARFDVLAAFSSRLTTFDSQYPVSRQ